MTLAAVDCVNRYVGNNTTTVYNFTWLLPELSQLLVATYDPATDTTTPLILDTDYSLSSVFLNNPSGGAIELLGGNLGSGIWLVLMRDIPLNQTTSIRSAGDFYPYVHEDTFDRLVMQVQQLKEALDRTVALPKVADPAVFSPVLPTFMGSAGKLLMVNAGGTGLSLGASPTVGPLTVVTKSATYVIAAGVDVVLISGNGTITITLPAAASSQGRLIRVKVENGTGNKVVVATGGTIDGASSKTLTGLNSAAFLSDGTNWWIV